MFPAGNGGVGMLLSPCCQNEDSDSGLDRSRFHNGERLDANGISTATELCFLDDGLDWNHIRVTAGPVCLDLPTVLVF